MQEALTDLTMPSSNPPGHIKAHVMTADVTGDTTPDVIMDLNIPGDVIPKQMAVFVFVCRDRRYELNRLQWEQLDIDSVELGAVKDMNRDGVAEIVFQV